MLHHAMSILLHYPHSRLDSLAARNADSCAPDRPLTASGAVLNSHTRHVVAAADEISRLITHRAPLRSHTPFFTCAVVLASVVHLNQWVAVLSGDDEALREKVRLSIGALSVMSEVWRTAAVARGQVRGVAREIYEAKRKHGEGDGVSTEVDVWGGIKDSCDDIPLDGFLELINGR